MLCSSLVRSHLIIRPMIEKVKANQSTHAMIEKVRANQAMHVVTDGASACL